MAEEEKKPIRVVDRRMFTPEGELRPDYEPEPETAPREAPSKSQAAAEKPGAEQPPRAAEEPQGDFVSLIHWLAAMASSALGLVPDPAGRRRPDPATARQMIDWLAALELKTRGNVSFEESELLSRILYELRLGYVEVTRPPAK